MTNINQFLPFYIGCEMLTYWGEQKEILTLKGVIGDVAIYGYDKDYNTILHSWDMSDPETKHPDKPILRPLESMTEEEDFHINNEFHGKFTSGGHFIEAMKNNTPYTKNWQDCIELFRYLLSKHFDIFNLHSQGLCLYRNDKGELY
jgi:hypothetical protein